MGSVHTADSTSSAPLAAGRWPANAITSIPLPGRASRASSSSGLSFSAQSQGILPSTFFECRASHSRRTSTWRTAGCGVRRMARGAVGTFPGHPAGIARLRFRPRRDPPRGRKAARPPPSPVRCAALRRTRDGLLGRASPGLATIVAPSRSGSAVATAGAAGGAVAAGLRTACVAAVPGDRSWRSRSRLA